MFHETNELPDSVFDEQRRRWLEGEQPDAERLLHDSGQHSHSEALLDLLYHEIMLKEELGIPSTIEDYCDRYPELTDDLILHFEVHQAVRQQLLCDTDSLGSDRSVPVRSFANEPICFPNSEYDVRNLIGQGAMATVYQAKHRRLHRDVALKIFQPGRLLTSNEVSRIRIEAAAIARLAHPNIIQIFEIGDVQGSPFLALELATGGTLAKRLSISTMGADAAAELIETLSRAVEHAHDRDVIHRDIKPANILFAEDGTPKLTDFGLAKVLTMRDIDAVAMTRTGEALGTPRYMSPEQAAGQHDRVCPATDVYALGTVLYECLTGYAPFMSASVSETLYSIMEKDPIPPRKLQPSIPRDLQTICLHCLAKEPSRRYSTAEELADDLRRFRNREPIQARPSTVFERTAKWCRKRPVHAAFIALVTLLITTGMFSAITAARNERVRLHRLKAEVARLVNHGRAFLDQNELETAQSRFREAWQIVQAEPKLSDHETSVTGWLDHSRNALNRYSWKQRIPPRDFDHRRDEAIFLSLLPFLDFDHPISVAQSAIQEAMELTIPQEVTWNSEREQLFLIKAELTARQSGSAAALSLLDATDEFDSQAFHLQRAVWLKGLHRGDEARAADEAADRHPPQKARRQFFAGMSLIRDDQFSKALPLFGEMLNQDPEHFAARLMQAFCFLKLNRIPEATVGLTACIAQRPNFQWNYVLRGLARQASNEPGLAFEDFQAALTGHPSEPVKFIVQHQMGTSERTMRPDDAPFSSCGPHVTSQGE